MSGCVFLIAGTSLNAVPYYLPIKKSSIKNTKNLVVLNTCNRGLP